MTEGHQSNESEGSAPAGGYKQISNGLHADQREGIDRAFLLESYERELKHALRWAHANASLHAISQFLALCTLTWASLVLLRAYASYLLLLDFAFIACLLVLEAARLVSSASLFICLPTCTLAHLSQDPRLINHGKGGRNAANHRAGMVWLQILQFILIFPGFIVPSIRIFSLNLYDPNIRNLQNSLRIFYSLVTLNSLVALINLISSALAVVSLEKFPEQSILRYYDRVVKNAVKVGVVKADDFKFFSFAYAILGSEYRRNVQPEAVAKNYRKLIHYLYAHRLGLDFLQIFMDAEDVFVQLAAVNMVGFWADTAWGVGLMKEVKLPEEVLTKLADKVGTGQLGWAATSSVGVLARKPKGAYLVARTCTRSGVRLPDRLADLVDSTSCRSLCLVRTLASFYEQLCVNEKEAPKPFSGKAERALVAKLRKLAEGAKVQRLRVQAAYLLLMMGEECRPSVIAAIDPTQDTYWFQSEVSMLHLLRKHVPYGEPADPFQLQLLDIRKDSNITPPPWAQPCVFPL